MIRSLIIFWFDVLWKVKVVFMCKVSAPSASPCTFFQKGQKYTIYKFSRGTFRGGHMPL